MDLLRTRKKEDEEIAGGLHDQKDIIIDNTNTTVKSRKKYIELARLYGVGVRAIYLKCTIDVALQRNSTRLGKERIPDNAVRFYNKILRPPTVEEGFDSVEEINAE